MVTPPPPPPLIFSGVSVLDFTNARLLLGGMNQCLEGMEHQLGDMNQHLDGVQETLREMWRTLREVQDTAYQVGLSKPHLHPHKFTDSDISTHGKAYNCAHGPGMAIPFKILPFYLDNSLEVLPQNVSHIIFNPSLCSSNKPSSYTFPCLH